ncbi:MAG: RNA polymerase factor sigma-54 [Candidatus Omnitrophica bacterium]|nr:RNA polymerase factor sigma-54 [Candidatus Omnitrophota bacterium]MCB9746935.1 RNA polymerase factor sigma-54 [Candidatus Omnitrophota bacterium]
MKIKLNPSQIQKTVLAPHMQQSIEVLLLPIEELNTAIELELQNNPLLEIDEKSSTNDHDQFEEILQSKLKNQEDNSLLTPSYFQNEEEYEEKPIAEFTPLEDYLLQQLHLEVTNPLEIKIGELIIGNLNEDGYFHCSCKEIAALAGTDNVKLVEEILLTIQNFEPLGIASRDLTECLLIQIHYKIYQDTELLREIITNHFNELGRKKYADIAKALKISQEKIQHLAHVIATLEPKPARSYRPVNENIYIKPDVYIVKDNNDQYQVVINQDTIPCLRISHFYQTMLKQNNRSAEEKEFIKEKIKNALTFIKSIDQRNQTIYQIAQYIVKYQKDFFDQGSAALKPMILKDIAQVISRNESTVCRAINNKYMETPQGLLPMKFFFTQGINQEGEESISSHSIKEEIRSIIAEEDKSHPLSDQDIQNLFERKGFKVARRTVSKYRQALHILPSNLRKE